MSCQACRDAEANPLTGSFYSRCMDCMARMLAHSPLAFDAVRRGEAEKLQDVIRRAWPDDYERGRSLVWQWMKRIDAAKSAMKG